MAEDYHAESSPVDPEEIKPVSWLFFFILFTLIFLMATYFFSEIKKEFKLLEEVNVYWLIVAILGQFLTYYFTAIIYRLLLTTQNLPQLPSLWRIMTASVISLCFNQTMPSAGISGNTFFASFLSRLSMRGSQILSIILAELFIFYAAMELVIIFLGISCLLVYKRPHVFPVTLTAGMMVYLLFAILITMTEKKVSPESVYKRIRKSKLLKKLFDQTIQSFRKQKITNKDIQFLGLLKNNKNKALKTIVGQILVIVADAFTLYALFWGLGVHVSWFDMILCLITTKIISIIPFLPGALVLYESSMSFLFSSAGIAVGPAIVVTLLYRFLSFWIPIPLGLFLYRRWLKNASRVH